MPTKLPNLVELQKQRLALTKALQAFTKETGSLEKTVARQDASVATALRQLRGVLKKINEDLVEALDAALNERDERKRLARYDAAGKVAAESFAYLSNPKVTKLAEHPEAPMTSHGPLVKVLGALARTLD